MIKKSIFIGLIIIIVLVAIYLYFSQIQNTKTQPIPIDSSQIIANKNNTQESSGSELQIPDTQEYQEQIFENRTGNQTGITVTINSNGRPIRSMTPEELKLFQQKIQNK